MSSSGNSKTKNQEERQLQLGPKDPLVGKDPWGGAPPQPEVEEEGADYSRDRSPSDDRSGGWQDVQQRGRTRAEPPKDARKPELQPLYGHPIHLRARVTARTTPPVTPE